MLFLKYLFIFIFLPSSTSLSTRCTAGLPTHALTGLNSYVNQWPGLMHDHIATTWTYNGHPNTLSQYYQLGSLGLVLKSEHRKDCECAIEAAQVFDEFFGLGGTSTIPGLFGRLNHKLLLGVSGPFPLMDNYLQTGERFYCVRTYGECGASVPLREWQVETEYDTVYTTNATLQGSLGVTDKGTLCYIWPTNYKSFDKASDTQEIVPTIQQFSIVPHNPLSGLTGTVSPVNLLDLNEETQCPQLTADNGQWILADAISSVGSMATLSCAPGYVPSQGSGIIVCQSSLKWMPDQAKCIYSGCKELNSTGRVNYNVPALSEKQQLAEKNGLYPMGTKALLKCHNNTGVSTQSADAAICTEKGWVPEELGECQKVCPKFILHNGHVRYTDYRGMKLEAHTNGTIATVVCDTGTRLDGAGSAVCLNGEWSTAHIGTCELLTCPTVKPVDKGKITSIKKDNEKEAFLVGDILRLRCNPNSSLVGASESVCEANEKWQPKLGHCQ